MTKRSAVIAAVIVGATLLSGAAGAKNTPYPPPSGGSGTESTSGTGVGAGFTFTPHYAIATYEPIGGHYVLYLTSKPVSCTHAYLATPPYLTISIVTDGSRLVVDRPSLQSGDKDFVQVDFFIPKQGYVSVQPGVQLVLTRVSTKPNSLWHGRITVPVTHYQGKTFSFKGTFAARWCGKQA